MLRISKKGDYAVLLMCHLARHGLQDQDTVVSAQEIADRTGVQKAVVANLLKGLTRAGLLESVRGLRGGYRLGVPAGDISLARILEVIEGPFLLVDCASDSHDAEHGCSLQSGCPSTSPMRVLHNRIAKIMEDIKLPELAAVPNPVTPCAAPTQPPFSHPTT